MKAAYLLNGAIEVGRLDDPVPGEGEVLVETHSCGLCASDLHLVRHGEALVKWSKETGGYFSLDLACPIVLGHEYVGAIVDYGPGCTRRLKKGTRVTSRPVVLKPGGAFSIVGISNDYPGGMGELMLLGEDLLRPIPDALDTDMAAMAEPLSVGYYYASAGRVTSGDVSLVVGCGAIGLAVIMALKMLGHHPIVAADFSPTRREQAIAMGADIVIDPTERSPYLALSDAGNRAPNVIFECVGVPGVMDQIMRNCTPGARILVAGWCLETDHMLTACAHAKGLTLAFGGGPNGEDFDAAVRALGDGRFDPSLWLGGRVGLSGAGAALDAVGNPLSPIRMVVDPRMA